MTTHVAGQARLDLFSDSLLLEVRDEVYVANVTQFARLTSGKVPQARLARRYGDTLKKHIDIPCGGTLKKSKNRRGIIMFLDDAIYSLSLKALVAVAKGVESQTNIWEISVEPIPQNTLMRQATMEGY